MTTSRNLAPMEFLLRVYGLDQKAIATNRLKSDAGKTSSNRQENNNGLDLINQ
jgi:hypothetical protein